MHLADRCSRDGLWVPLGKDGLRRRAEFAADHVRRQLDAHGRGVVLELRERVPDRLGQSFVQVADHLPELHQRALHGAEFADDVLSVAKFSRTIEFLAPSRGSEDPLRSMDRLPAADSRTEPSETGVPPDERARHDGRRAALTSFERSRGQEPGDNAHHKAGSQGAVHGPEDTEAARVDDRGRRSERSSLSRTRDWLRSTATAADEPSAFA